MLILKTGKLAIASIVIAALTACTNNGEDRVREDLRTPRNVSTGDLKRPMRPANVSNQNQGQNSNSSYSHSEIQQMNNGYLTIDQNSYSTEIASDQFPHSKRMSNGQSWYYSFQPANQQPAGAPNQGGVSSASPNRTVQPAPVSNTAINRTAMQVIELTNNERRKHGLAPLTADRSLSRVAQTKTNEMNQKHYFSHTSPSYGSPFDMMRDFGVTYRTAGENIAMGQRTAQQVVTAWMNSEGHRKNILSRSYTKIGVGYTASGNYWSQMFVGR
jgi:uncharacterized YkwD family protein